MRESLVFRTIDLGDNQGMPPSDPIERVQAIIPRMTELVLR